MKSKINILLIVSGILLSIGAFGLVAYNMWDNYRAGLEAKNVIEIIHQYRDDHLSGVDAPPVSSFDEDDKKELPVVEIDGNRYIGTISIPSIETELPVLENYSLELMKTAPCRYMGSPYYGDFIICGHNYTTHFGKLGSLSVGDEVVFTDVEGNDFQYIVVQLETIDGTAVKDMEAGEWDMTLFTCTMSGQTRFTVRCSLIDGGSN